MARLTYDDHFLTDDALIRAIRGQQARVRQTHQEYKVACQTLTDLCALARTNRPDSRHSASRDVEEAASVHR